MPIKNITGLKDSHKDKDIYIVASGKSGDFIDPSFFENKITIGVNQVFKRFKTNYLLRKEHKFINDILRDNPETVHIISAGNCGQGNRINVNYLNKNHSDNENIYYFNHNHNYCTSVQLPKKEENKLIVSYSTITSAMHMAAYMGAKNIILLGHDCGTIDGECNFIGYHTKTTMVQNNTTEYKNWLKQIENQTLSTKIYLKATYNANVYSLNPFINFGLEGHIYKR